MRGCPNERRGVRTWMVKGLEGGGVRKGQREKRCVRYILNLLV